MVTYHEHIVKRAKTGKDFAISMISPFAFAFCAYILSGLFATVLRFFSFLIPAVWVGAIYASYKTVASRNVEFEYLLVDSDLDIDRITNKIRRKRVISVYRKEILAMAPVGSKNLPEDWKSLDVINAASHIDAEDAYVLIAQQEGIKKAIVFCPTEKMIETISLRNPRKVFND